ncbi:MAG: hypothetical protein P8M25_04040 [Paracoccaceae bacterium]|nr:hypothetical protein [Paracoccaceae bacterium]
MPYQDVFELLKASYLAPPQWWSQVKIPYVFRFESREAHRSDAGLSKRLLPALLKTYLMMGAG